MPKASLHHNDLAVARKHNVWTPLQVFDVQTKAVPELMEKGSHD